MPMIENLDEALKIDESDLQQARRVNTMIGFLPRYETSRRLDARLLNKCVRVVQALLPDTELHQGRTTELTVPSSRTQLRLIKPDGQPRGLLLHFHGGAWVTGNARLEQRMARAIADECGLLVCVPDFRNAVDDDLAATLRECKMVAEWVVHRLKAWRMECVLLSGESSGAHLAAEALLHLRSLNKHQNVAGFYSVCGAFDLQGSVSLRASSRKSLLIDGQSALENARRLGSSLSGEEQKGPIRADLSDLPPALFVAANLDPILNDSIDMHARWQRQANNAQLLIVPEAIHGFNRLPISLARKTNSFGRQWMNQVIDRWCGD
jgi:acetyl esterase/lipase